MSSSTSVKCLGVIWSSNLSPKAAIEHNIHKARRAFFATGALGTTKGKLIHYHLVKLLLRVFSLSVSMDVRTGC